MGSSSLASLASMGGMDMSSDGLFRKGNAALARVYWYIIAGVLGFGLLLNGVRVWNVWWRRRLCRARSITHPTRPLGWISQTYATTLAIIREASYPQVFCFTGRWTAWMTPPPLGRSLVLLSYWVLITVMLTSKSIVHDAYYWERIGFRAAWVSVTQVPLIYLLAGKVNVVGILIGSSHERLNWLHRWIARTLFITVTIHGSFFLAEWVRADFVKLELSMMSMVKYGLGAWGVLAWTMISSLQPFRQMAYELFVLQHLASAGVLLWLLYLHVPKYAAYNIWFAIAAVAFDRTARGCWLLYRNLTLKRGTSKQIGYTAELQAMAGDVTVLTIRDVLFSWRPGQHLFLWIPRLGFVESHPFTISNIPREGNGPNDAELVIRAYGGFSRRLHRRALSSQPNKPAIMKAFITGPFGAPPAWNTFETIILISASTGASFTIPVLESVLQDPCCVRRVDFFLLVRERPHCNCYLQRLRQLIPQANSLGISLRVEIVVTGSDDEMDLQCCSGSCMCGRPSKPSANPHVAGGEKSSQLSTETPFSVTTTDTIDTVDKEEITTSVATSQDGLQDGGECQGLFHFSLRRPNLLHIIRAPVEAAFGETSVAVCGNKSLIADVRNCVSRLSDERAVHKGTGAQGIHLFTEEYCF